ncbi:DUF418 domain-containing protein [Acanthopleuribacter pedis]|uniref:DUF418 domain-containing protein n=1 Tax=Acanthopleuribacter pedis TaxID=442870 RepID=A0A8J7QBK6_9BACT|nr:DUF418 domain-containing protein [Acanthopleuribacter pedis]MBO1322576.1 DUF418 domain-containing protein [Acanthopleuribacter pedis]
MNQTESAQVTRNFSRIIAFDVARAFALFGMIFVNFKITIGAETVTGDLLGDLIGLLEGRAAALFVILAGTGLSLLSRKARESKDAARLAANRVMIWRRALFLFVFGLLYTPIWPADILHFYGVYLLFGGMLLNHADRTLINASVLFVLIGYALLFTLDYAGDWNFTTLEYHNFWTLTGLIKHLFFNGFHPVFPWASFLTFGMWLGRLDLSSAVVRRKLWVQSLWVFVAAQWVLPFLFAALFRMLEVSTEDTAALVSRSPMPPTPFYIFSAGATACMLLLACFSLCDQLVARRRLQPLVATGQMALTLYVAHVLIGMGGLEAMGLLGGQSLAFSALAALTFSALCVAFATAWRAKFRHGPVEWFMRKTTGF